MNPIVAAMKYWAPLVIGLLTAWGALSVERARNADTREDVAQIKAAAPAEIRWHQRTDDRLEAMEHALDRIEDAVGSKHR